MNTREISEWKEKDGYNSWVYYEDLNDAIRKFAETQSDGKYCLS